MGGFKCSCGYILGRSDPETGTSSELVRQEVLNELLDADLIEWENLLHSFDGTLTECPNCQRIHLERSGTAGIVTYERETDPPRIWADFSRRDALDRIVLDHPRSLADIARYHLLNFPPIRIIAYNEDSEVRGETRWAVDGDGNLREDIWTVAPQDED